MIGAESLNKWERFYDEWDRFELTGTDGRDETNTRKETQSDPERQPSLFKW